jgi:hypothetical protein
MRIPPEYFLPDGQPDTLLGYVLAGLGVGPEHVVADLLPYNTVDPARSSPPQAFP